MKTLGEIYLSVCQSPLSDCIANGNITKVNILNEARLVKIKVDFPALIDVNELFTVEKKSVNCVKRSCSN